MPFFLQPEFPIGTRFNACCTCNTDRREGDRLVDLGINIDFEGYLIMCETCAKEIAHLLGYKTEDAAAKLVAQGNTIRDLKQENGRLRKAVDEVTKVVNA